MEFELKKVREWAQSKIDAGQEPPWAWYQYMKLIETTDAILASFQATTENLQLEAPHQAMHPRLVVSSDSPNNVQRHSSDVTVQMPM